MAAAAESHKSKAMRNAAAQRAMTSIEQVKATFPALQERGVRGGPRAHPVVRADALQLVLHGEGLQRRGFERRSVPDKRSLFRELLDARHDGAEQGIIRRLFPWFLAILERLAGDVVERLFRSRDYVSVSPDLQTLFAGGCQVWPPAERAVREAVSLRESPR